MPPEPHVPRDEPDRFDRQVRFAPLGRAGQERLAAARVLVVGCGATGGVLAQSLARAGVGTLVLVDRDIVEITNLPRQVLFDDDHAARGVPKALAAAETLLRAGGPSRVEAHAMHLDAGNVDELARAADLVLDGTDNLATRYLLNDWCVKHGVPWIYAGVVGGAGLVLPVLPGRGACLRCVFPDPPPPGTLPTCDSAGVILPAVGAVASLAAGLALRLLARPDALETLEPALIELDAWNGEVRRITAARAEDCPACARGEYPFLERAAGRAAETLCGRDTVQIPATDAPPDLARIAQRLEGLATDVLAAGVLLRFAVDDLRITLFADGRALVEGTEDLARARAAYDRYVGA